MINESFMCLKVEDIGAMLSDRRTRCILCFIFWCSPAYVISHAVIHALLLTLRILLLFPSPKSSGNIIQTPLPIVSKSDDLGTWHDGYICLWWINMLGVAILIGLLLGTERGERHVSLRNFSTSSFLFSQRRMQTETLFFFKVVRASFALPTMERLPLSSFVMTQASCTLIDLPIISNILEIQHVLMNCGTKIQ